MRKLLPICIFWASVLTQHASELQPKDEMMICWVVSTFLQTEYGKHEEVLDAILDPRITGNWKITEQIQKQKLLNFPPTEDDMKFSCKINNVQNIEDGVYVTANPQNEKSNTQSVFLVVVKRSGTWFITFAEPSPFAQLFMHRFIHGDKNLEAN